MADTGIKIGQFIERQQLEQQLRQSQKMEAIGQLAGGIAHDFNNVLTVIAGYSELLLARVGREDPLYGELQEIRKAGNRAAALTNQLLAFSRRQVLAPKLLNLNEVISGIEQMLRRLIGEDIGLVIIPGQDLGFIKADPGQVEQVIINLAVNARDAMTKGGKLIIQTANGLFDRPQMSERVTIQSGQYVILTVSDTGHGMDAKTQSRIFEPFFTTKEKGKGTGLGLATVYGIVKLSDGYITVYSALGRGTTFKVYLPMITAEAEAEPPPRTSPGSLDGSDTILVVEDEVIIRSLVTRILQSHRYRVLEAANAKEALQLCDDYSGPVHLLVTDVVMPEISGPELARRLSSQRPEMRVLYMSGYTDDAIVRHGVLQERMPFLQKPFTPDMLAWKVREVLTSINLKS
jgi:nitrogen-specific signal transduction histidine kinase